VLFTAIPSAGHVNPLLPLARTLVTAGHKVMLASGNGAAMPAKSAGLVFVRAGLDEPEMMAQAATQLRDVAAQSRGIEMFASIAAPAMLRDLLPEVEDLAPDLLINEEGEWGGPLLASIVGIPAVAHGWGAPLWSQAELAAISTATAPLWAEHGITPASPAGLFDGLYIDACPPLLQTAGAKRIARRRPIRFEAFDSGEALPPWLDAPRRHPLVYATLGTVPTFNFAPALFAALAGALGELPVDAVLAIGRNNDPDDLQPLPTNVRAVSHLSQVQVLSRSAVAITHGGAGSTLAALSFGIPLLILPRGAPSQRRLASRCAELGAAVVLQQAEAHPGAIREAVQALIEDEAFRVSAQHIRDSIHDQPTVQTLVPHLEILARSR
jgi:UDP:flavonoid glycosyltransferase YjiC (YdhE family)